MSFMVTGAGFGNIVVRDIKRRWNEAEQPLFVLAFCFHPEYRDLAVGILQDSVSKNGLWNKTKNTLNAARLLTCAVYYYKKHELWIALNEEGRKKEIEDFAWDCYRWLAGLEKLESCFRYLPENFPHPALWFIGNEGHLSASIIRFACFLFDCPVQGATCERLFKEFSRFLKNQGTDWGQTSW